MPADIAAESAVFHGARNAAKMLRIRLQHRDRPTLLREQVGGRQPRRAATDANHPFFGQDRERSPRNRSQVESANKRFRITDARRPPHDERIASRLNATYRSLGGTPGERHHHEAGGQSAAPALTIRAATPP